MISKIKNWWFAIFAGILVILDQGFLLVNPLLVDIGVSGRWIGVVKILFFLYGAFKLKNQLPTTNNEKLKDILNTAIADDLGGSNPPPGKDDK